MSNLLCAARSGKTTAKWKDWPPTSDARVAADPDLALLLRASVRFSLVENCEMTPAEAVRGLRPAIRKAIRRHDEAAHGF
jgi:hypothetical protein